MSGYIGKTKNNQSGGFIGSDTLPPMFVNSQTVNRDLTVKTGTSSISAGPITQNVGTVVTIEDGARWVIL